MSHFFYVAASYGAASATVLGLVLWVWLDGRGRRRELQSLESAGIRRRSAFSGTAE
jgi:heme exporter protein D